MAVPLKHAACCMGTGITCNLIIQPACSDVHLSFGHASAAAGIADALLQDTVTAAPAPRKLPCSVTSPQQQQASNSRAGRRAYLLITVVSSQSINHHGSSSPSRVYGKARRAGQNLERPRPRRIPLLSPEPYISCSSIPFRWIWPGRCAFRL